MNNIYYFTQQGNAKVLFVESLFNEIQNKRILEEVASQIEGGHINFIMDISNVPFINSAGLNCLLSIKHKSQKAGGQFSVSGASTQVVKLLEITKLKPFFKMIASLNEGQVAGVA